MYTTNLYYTKKPIKSSKIIYSFGVFGGEKNLYSHLAGKIRSRSTFVLFPNSTHKISLNARHFKKVNTSDRCVFSYHANKLPSKAQINHSSQTNNHSNSHTLINSTEIPRSLKTPHKPATPQSINFITSN